MRLSKKLYFCAALLMVCALAVLLVLPRKPNFTATFVRYTNNSVIILLRNSADQRLTFGWKKEDFTCAEAFATNLPAAPFEDHGAREVTFGIVSPKSPPAELELFWMPQSSSFRWKFASVPLPLLPSNDRTGIKHE